ncbi:hypothetical protein [Mycobacterium attenuatum]|uniref:hypothetical protein n=1 Tax=Mycobacterium attenuatum TaxID=2341086 RepID=UPI000F2D48E5|nr:hypothetical protein [Mycobacterium attenuatum]VBA60121.1 hypothetical protein LAUMK41_03818 [Mycobacterium attenuatum]
MAVRSFWHGRFAARSFDTTYVGGDEKLRIDDLGHDDALTDPPNSRATDSGKCVSQLTKSA